MSVISVENLSKAYRIGMRNEVPDTLVGAMKGILAAPFRNAQNLRRLNTNNVASEVSDRQDTLWALKHISFSVGQGEVVGVIGRNGAGKSTLLKILSRITEPSSGRAIIRGRVSSLLEVGTGFHPELTGRDNIYMNGTILGMRKREIDQKFDEIVDFSGVEKFLDTAVKRYSSGMKVRLAFAVAAHLEPEILIIDEVLAVGDAEFQKKCLGKMKAVAGDGRTVLFVSHNMAAVKQLCQRAAVLQHGQVTYDGTADEAVSIYLRGDGVSEDTLSERDNSQKKAYIHRVQLLDEQGFAQTKIIAGVPIRIHLEIKSKAEFANLRVGMTVYREDETAVTHCPTSTCDQRFNLSQGDNRLECQIPNVPFPVGRYRMALAIFGDGKSLDHAAYAAMFDVVGSRFFPTGKSPEPGYCAVMVPHSWSQKAGLPNEAHEHEIG